MNTYICDIIYHSNSCKDIDCKNCPFNDKESAEKLFDAIRNKTLTIN